MHFIADSGATVHIVDPTLLEFDVLSIASNVQASGAVIDTANGPARVSSTADLHFRMADSLREHCVLRGVHLVPGSGHLLYSCTKLARAQGSATFQRDGAHMLVPDTELPEGDSAQRWRSRVRIALTECDGHYWFALTPHAAGAAAARRARQEQAFVALVAQVDGAAQHELWHQRLGHINDQDLQRLAATPGTGVTLPADGSGRPPCDTCHIGKARAQPHPPAAALDTAVTGHTWHLDRAEFGVRGADGSYYALLFTDEATRLTFGHCTSNKRDAVEGVELLREELLVPEALHMHRLRCDGAGDFEPLHAHAAAAGYRVVNSAPHTPQTNGIAERKVQEIKKVARCCMAAAALPQFLWPYAVQHAIYLLNRRPTRALAGKTPLEAWSGAVPDLTRLRIFGCNAFVRAEGANKRALTAGWRGRYLGHSQRAPGAFLVYNESTRQIITTRNVTFLETPLGVAPASGDTEARAADAADTGSADPSAGSGAGEGAPAAGAPQGVAQQLADVAQPAAAQQPLAQQDDGDRGGGSDAPRGPDLGSGRTRSGRGYTPADLAAVVGEGVVDVPERVTEPASYKEACAGAHSGLWRAAMEREYSELEGHGTWELIPQSQVPAGAQVLGSGWAYKDKGVERPAHLRFKARVVARGCQQRPGSYGEAFAPTADMSAVRTVLALAAAQGWEVSASDVHNAFCQSTLPHAVYMRQPEGFARIGDNGKPLIMRLRKSLYGLHESANLWHETIKAALRKLGYEESTQHACVFKHPTTGIIQVVYVDDNLHTGTSDAGALRAAVRELGGVFSIKELGFPQTFLGMELERRSGGGLALTQRGYTERVLKEHGMLAAHGACTPAAGSALVDDQSPPLLPGAAATYRTLMGELGWLALCTRPDIAFAVSQLQRYTSAPLECHMEGAKRILRYLASNAGGLAFARLEGEQRPELVGYADASFAADAATRRSHTGYVFMLGGAAVQWRSKQQSLVTLSTAEAEYVALCSASKDAIGLSGLLAFLGFKQGPITLLEDNAAAIRLAHDPAACKRTKHIDVQFHFVREQVQAGRIGVVAVSTELQHADVLTKALHAPKHHFHAAAIMGSG
jgi:hypothetical protein